MPAVSADGPVRSATFVPFAEPLWSVTLGGTVPVVSERRLSSMLVRETA